MSLGTLPSGLGSFGGSGGPATITDVSSGSITRTQTLYATILAASGDQSEAQLSILLNGTDERVWDGAAFTRKYAASTRLPVVGGYRFAIRRVGGWPPGSTFKLRIGAWDGSG